MGTSLEIHDLLKSRSELAEKMLYNLKNWDGTVESGLDIIEANQRETEAIRELNELLSNITYDSKQMELYKDQLELILREQKEFTKTLRAKQSDLLENIKQLNKKDKIANSYISINRESVFVDKDFK